MAIDKAKKGSSLHGLPHVSDPSAEVQEVLIACMNWNMATRDSKIPECDLPDLQQMAVDQYSIYQYIPLPVLITSFQYVLVRTSIHQYIQVYIGMY